MSVSSAPRVQSKSAPSSYATNWPAVWAAAGILVILVIVAIARQLFPTPAIDVEPPRVAVRHPAAAPISPHRKPTPVASRATIELAAAEPTLEFVAISQRALRRDSIVQSKNPKGAPSQVASAPRATVADKIASTEAVGDRSSAIHDRKNGGANEAWLKAVDELFPANLALDLQGHSLELDFLSLPGVVNRVPGIGRRGQKTTTLVRADSVELPELASRHAELAGLPFRRGEECRKSGDALQELKWDARQLHRVTDFELTGKGRLAASPDQEFRSAFESRIVGEYRPTPVGRLLTTEVRFQQPAAVDTLVQMLQSMEESYRFDLIGGLAAIKSPQSSAALANRAIYDLSPRVRDVARTELRKRPKHEYRDQLVAGLRYPWAPVADHAAQAIVALDLHEVIPYLNGMLALPDPNQPRQDGEGRWVKTEIVRVNHSRNCYLCHAPSTSASDVVRGVVPTPGEPLPIMYYDDPSGSFVRGDVTYLKQDFSVVQEVPNADPWPKFQRFDYLVRTREATLTEIALANAPEAIEDRNQDYPQRVAVLNALQGLLENAGRDAATSYDAATAETAARKNLKSPHGRR